MIYNRQHMESTAIQPCCTAAAVGDTIFVRLACLRNAAASCLCRRLEKLFTPPYQTFLRCCRSGCACPSMRNHRDLCKSNRLDTNPSLCIYVHDGSIFFRFIAKIADGRQQVTCGDQNATGRTMCVRVLYPLFSAASFFFLVIAYVTCYCPPAPFFSIHAASHATRATCCFLAVPNMLEFEL